MKRLVVLPLWGWILIFGTQLAASRNWGDAISASGLIALGVVDVIVLSRRKTALIDGRDDALL